jgi:hypothetical protein
MYLDREPLVQLIVSRKHISFALGAFFAGGHQGSIFVSLKETGDFTVGQQRVHALKERRILDVALIDHEDHLLALGAGAPKHAAQILIKLLNGIGPEKSYKYILFQK